MGTYIRKKRRGDCRLVSDEALVGCGVHENDAVVVGLSGGPDSVSLLAALLDAAARGRLKTVFACHVHHGIRGAAADDDERFCRSLCDKLCVPLAVARVDAPNEAKKQGVSLETAARELRYAALENARIAFGAEWIAVAHHRLDQAETVLMHLMRGAGLNGLIGMRNVNGRIIRPLLGVSKAEITAFLTENGIDFCTDETNSEPAAARNRVRNELLPLMETLRPGAIGSIADCAKRLSDDADYLDGEAEKAFLAAKLANGYAADKLLPLPRPLLARALMKILAVEHVLDGSAADVDRLIRLLSAASNTEIELRGGRLAGISQGVLSIRPAKERQSFCVPFLASGETRFPGGRFVAERVARAALPAKPNEAYLDLDRLPAALAVRTRCGGDRFYPLGSRGERLLSDCFTDRKLPKKARDIPLLADGGRILWTPGYTISELAKVTPSTERILHILFEEGTNV